MEEPDEREAEIYISLDRADQNAGEYDVELPEEIARLIIHGLLHLKGYDDKNNSAQQQMLALQERLLDVYWKSSKVEE
jgi:probable rRNA maturation factor